MINQKTEKKHNKSIISTCKYKEESGKVHSWVLSAVEKAKFQNNQDRRNRHCTQINHYNDVEYNCNKLSIKKKDRYLNVKYKEERKEKRRTHICGWLNNIRTWEKLSNNNYKEERQKHTLNAHMKVVYRTEKSQE